MLSCGNGKQRQKKRFISSVIFIIPQVLISSSIPLCCGIVGLQTDYCIDATVKCGFEHGLKMIVPANTNSTFDNAYMTAEKSYRYYNEFMWNGRYAECISFDKTLELMNR